MTAAGAMIHGSRLVTLMQKLALYSCKLAPLTKITKFVARLDGKSLGTVQLYTPLLVVAIFKIAVKFVKPVTQGNGDTKH